MSNKVQYFEYRNVNKGFVYIRTVPWAFTETF